MQFVPRAVEGINRKFDILSDQSEISYLIYWDDMRSSGKEDLINVFAQQLKVDDCIGDLGGTEFFDNCGVCGGDNSTCSDCAGIFGGEAYNNQCGTCICNGSVADDGFTCIESEECIQDCNQEWGGVSELDNCGVCDADSSNNDTTCSQDCNDVWGGEAEDLGCGCGETGPSGCDNTCGSTLVNDECGVCGGNSCYEQDCDTYPSDQFDCGGVILSLSTSIPSEFGLMQNYPNPFNPSTSISFSIPEFSMVSISIYNIHGQKIKSLVKSNMSPGYHQISWHGDDDNGISVSNGIYFYIMESSQFIHKKKMLFIK